MASEVPTVAQPAVTWTGNIPTIFKLAVAGQDEG